MSLPFLGAQNAETLIAERESAVVILTPWDEYYNINERKFSQSVEPLLSEDYMKLGIQAPEDDIAYSGADEISDDSKIAEYPVEYGQKQIPIRHWKIESSTEK